MGNEHMRCSAPVNEWPVSAVGIRLFEMHSLQRMGNEHMRCSAPVNEWPVSAVGIRLSEMDSLRRLEVCRAML